MPAFNKHSTSPGSGSLKRNNRQKPCPLLFVAIVPKGGIPDLGGGRDRKTIPHGT